MKKSVYLALGFLFVGIGAVGIVLPVLPTTPFLLLAAGCFAQSSERWHAWLINTRLFGGLIRDWEEHRCIARQVKISAIGLMAVVGGASLVWVLEGLWPRVITAALMLLGCGVVLRLKTCPSDEP